MESVEGVHYIFDRYAFINEVLLEHFKKRNIVRADSDIRLRIKFNRETMKLFVYLADKDGAPYGPRPSGPAEDNPQFFTITPDSDQSTVAKAVKLARALYHPDRFATETESIKDIAAQKRTLIEKAAALLLDEEIRPLYSQRLLEFYKNDPRLVSQNGTVIVPIGSGRDFFSLDSLLGEEVPDTAAFEAQVRQMTRFDESAFAQTAQIYQNMPESEQVRALYKQALTDKLTYLSLLEDAAWAKIGYAQKKDKTSGIMTHADCYADHVRAELTRVIDEELPKAVAARNDALRIGTAAPPLLLTDQRAEARTDAGVPAVMDEQTVQKVLARARENLTIRAEYVREIAAQKQAVLEELVTLADISPLRDRDFDEPGHVIVLAQQPEEGEAAQFMLAYEFNAQAGSVTILEDSLALSRQPLDEVLAVLKLPAVNAFLLMRNPEIADFNIEVVGAAETLVQEWQERRAPAETPPPAAP